MTRIAPVDLQFNPKTLWFDAGELDIEVGSAVVVSTARGSEYGHLSAEVFEATDEQVAKLKTALKPVVRVATEDDEAKAQEMVQLSKEAMPTFREMAEQFAPEMNPVSVEYLLDGDKAIFYFESEERIDFRDLVRKLASHFHVRVDMRQIGVRDEARMVGGIGHCGQELCCKRLGGEFCPVSIRMAKEQDLSLNPQKISGVCGRLMCCLRYEYDAYKDFKSRSPKVGATVHTPDGDGKVVDLDVPREIVSIRVGEEKPVKVPLSGFEPAEEGASRPNTVGQAAWDDANTSDVTDGVAAALVSFSTPTLGGKDKLAQPVATVRSTRKPSPDVKKSSGEGRGEGRSGGKNGASANDSSSRKPRRRRSTKISSPGQESNAFDARKSAEGNRAQSKLSEPAAKGKNTQNRRNSKRANSKTGKNAQGQQAKAKQAAKAQGQPKGSTAARPGQNSSALHRRSRRRSHSGTKGSASGQE